MTDTNPRGLIKRLADIADALDGRKPLVSAQGQAMDGFTALMLEPGLPSLSA
jgi:hypothetical protein